MFMADMFLPENFSSSVALTTSSGVDGNYMSDHADMKFAEFYNFGFNF
jgi:hypothetical protein